MDVHVLLNGVTKLFDDKLHKVLQTLVVSAMSCKHEFQTGALKMREWKMQEWKMEE